MSIWGKIGDVLTNPAFKIASGVFGLGAGTGAFGDTAANIAGGLNLASGAAGVAKNGASWDNVLQLGLGAADLGVGTGFLPKVSDSLFGEGGSFGGIGGSESPGNDLSFGGGYEGENTKLDFGSGSDDLDSPAKLDFKPTGGGESPFKLETTIGAGGGGQPTGSTGAAMGKPGGGDGTFLGNLQAALKANPVQSAGTGLALLGLLAPDQRGDVYSLATGMAKNSAAQAERANAAALTRYQQAQTEAAAAASLDSPQAKGWIDNYTTAANTELDRQYQVALSAMDARHSRRGISDSSVAATERTQLEAKYAEARARIISDARNEWLKYATAMIGNYNAALKPGATEAELLANQAARSDQAARQGLVTAAATAAPNTFSQIGNTLGKTTTTR